MAFKSSKTIYIENLTVWFKIQIFKSSLLSEIISRKKSVAGFFLLNHVEPLSYNSIRISMGVSINLCSYYKEQNQDRFQLQETG